MQLLIFTNRKENIPLRLRLPIVRVEVKMGMSRINCSKNANFTNVITKIYKMRNVENFSLHITLLHFSKIYFISFDKIIRHFC